MTVRKFSQLIGIVCLVIASITKASAQQVFFDNYETTPTGVTVGSPPPNPPYIVFGTNATDSVTVVSGVSQSGGNSLHVLDTSNTGLTGFRRSFVETNIMPTGRLSFDFRLDSIKTGDGSGPSLELFAPQLDNFGIPARIIALEFFAFTSGPNTNVTFRLQTAGFPTFTSQFPMGSFQHILIGWNNANLSNNGSYFVTWNGITNSFTPLIPSFTNIVAFNASDVGFGGGNYNYYVDNMFLEVPEPSVAALSLMTGFAVLFLRRK